MDHPDKNSLYELDILKHVEDSSKLNNRMVASKLGCSVKLAHSLLGKMVEKGLLHVKKIHSRRWDYFLTPKGIAEKTRLTLDFLEFSMTFYREARKRSAQVCKDLHDAGIKKVDFLGGGELAEICALGLQEWDLELVNVFADDKKTFLGRPVKNVSELVDGSSEAVIVCLSDKQNPMKANYLPDDVLSNDKMYWIF